MRGELSCYKTREILQQAIEDSWEGILHFRFLDGSGNIRLVIKDGYIGDVFSQTAPQWSELLLPIAVHPQDYVKAIEQNANVTYALQALRNKGLLSRQDLQNALKARVDESLVPILPKTDGRFMFSRQKIEDTFLKPGVSIRILLSRVDHVEEAHADMDTAYHVLQFPKMAESKGLPYVSEIVFALERGSTPLEIAKKIPLPWNRLAEIIKFLEEKDFIRRFQMMNATTGY